MTWQEVRQLTVNHAQQQEPAVNGLQLKLGQIDERLNRLTDAYIDRLIEKDLFEQRKTALLSERLQVAETLAGWETGSRNIGDELLEILGRANTAHSLYKSGLQPEKRELVDSFTSDRLLSGKTLEISLQKPFDLIGNRLKETYGSPRRDKDRATRSFLQSLLQVIRSRKENLASGSIFLAPSPLSCHASVRRAPRLLSVRTPPSLLSRRALQELGTTIVPSVAYQR